ncbi:MAG TPA: hypothetical protein VFK86_07270 [Bauldia sp.]|nr:hypothetical protein [Bauldia sp.]
MHGLAVELAPFEIAQTAGEDQLLAASRRLEADFLANADGYLGRLLLKQDEHRYLDLVLWRSQADADKAVEAAMASEACHAYFACMANTDHQEPGAGVEHYRVVRAFGQFAALVAETHAA